MQKDVINDRQVDIIVMDCTLEAMAISTVLESFNILVRRHFVGNIKQLIQLLSHPSDLYSTVIICCHGSKQGLLLPELADEIEQQMPYHHVITANDYAEFLKLDDKLVLTTGCCLGQPEFAKSFLRAGARAYLGPQDYIDGNACIIFMINFMYNHLIKKLSINDAWQADNKIIDDENKFELSM